jgi:hypothetical protein
MSEKLYARELVVTPRIPIFPRDKYTGNPWTTLSDVVADCDVPGCGYHVMGKRPEVKKALDDHRKMYHSDQVGVVLLNQPRQ